MIVRRRIHWQPRAVRGVGGLLLAVLSVAPAVSLVRSVARYWVNIPHMDQWDISHVFVWHRDHTLSIEKLLIQHNESRKVFPRLVFLGMGLLSGYDVRWEMALTIMVAGVISLNLLLLLRRQPGLGLVWRLVLWAALNLILFSPVQWNNWLWGIQLVVFIPPLMLTSGLLAVTSKQSLRRRAFLAGLCAFVATFSYANGMLLWALLLPLGIVATKPRDVRRPGCGSLWATRAAYGAAWALTMLVYFRDYRQPPGKPSMALVLHQPLAALGYFLAWAGSPLVPKGTEFSPDIRVITGGIVVGLFLASIVAATRLRRLKDSHPWIVIGLYSLASGLATTAGRMGFGMDQAADSRYTSFSLYLLVAIIGVFPILARARPGRVRRPTVTAAACMAAGLAVAFFHTRAIEASSRAMRSFSVGLQEGSFGLSLHRAYADTGRLVLLYPNVQFLLERYGELRSMGLLDVHAPDTPVWAGRKRFSPGDPAWGCFDECTLISHDSIRFWGWVRNPSRHIPGTNVVLVATDERGVSWSFAIRRVGIPRPDVAEFLGEPDMAKGGFAGQADVRSLPSGRLEISAWTVDLAGGEAHQIGGTHVVVRD